MRKSPQKQRTKTKKMKIQGQPRQFKIICEECEKYNCPQITQSEDINNFMKDIVKTHINIYECFYAIYLNHSNKIIGYSLISQGGVTATNVDVKLVMFGAINTLATGLILVHNHPSGNTKPSREDEHITKEIVEASKLFQIRVLDHLILTDESYTSFADEGLI